MPAMLTYIAGVGFKPGAQDRLRASVAKEPLVLLREPQNPYDKHAVAVFSQDGIALGYVPAVDAKAISWAMALDMSVTAYLTLGGTSTAMQISWENFDESA